MTNACFIVAPFGTDLAPLVKVVTGAGWRVLNLESVEPGAQVYLETTSNLIESANAVILVMTEQTGPNAFFEAGLAIGHGLPVLLVEEENANANSLESNRLLPNLPRVRAKLTDGDALQFQISAFLEGVERKQISLTSPSLRPEPSHAIKTSKKVSRSHGKASELESRLFDAFDRSSEVEGVHLEHRMGGGRFYPDFAVWFRSHPLPFPNPLIVELTGQSGRRIHKLEQLKRYAIESGVRAVMLVHATRHTPLTLSELMPMTFEVSLSELERLLDSRLLVPQMIRSRNLLAHSVS